MTKLVAVIDLDGVILDFEYKWQMASERIYGEKTVKVADTYSFEERYNVSSDHVKKVFEEMDWSKIPVYEGVKEAIDTLKEKYKIIFCSAANIHLHDDRKASLNDRGIYFDELILVGDDPKQIHYENADIVIDDHEKHIIEALSESVPNIFFVDRGYSCMNRENITCNIVNSFEDAVTITMEKEKQLQNIHGKRKTITKYS